MTKKYPFSSDGRYTYGFTTSGLFTLLDRDGEPLAAQVLPLCEKLGSHLLWIATWVACILIAAFFGFTAATPFFMAVIFLHLFLFGCRLTTLLIKGGVKALFFPPLWVRLSRELEKGGDLELLKRYSLDRHPGLLVNLALVQFKRDQVQEAQQTLQRAQALSPDHPDIDQIIKATAQFSS